MIVPGTGSIDVQYLTQVTGPKFSVVEMHYCGWCGAPFTRPRPADAKSGIRFCPKHNVAFPNPEDAKPVVLPDADPFHRHHRRGSELLRPKAKPPVSPAHD